MSKLKNRIVLYIIIGYFIASWGVNGSLNPLVYYQNIINHEQIPVKISYEADEIVLDLQASSEKYPYVSFEFDPLDTFSLNITTIEYPSKHTIVERDFILYRGLNCIKLSSDDILRISISNIDSDKHEISLKNAMQSNYKKVNVFKAIEIWLFFIFLSVFYEGLNQLKKRYL